MLYKVRAVYLQLLLLLLLVPLLSALLSSYPLVLHLIQQMQVYYKANDQNEIQSVTM